MGFCRRCGDIVAAERCFCGGAAVAPVFAWSNHEKKTVENPVEKVSSLAQRPSALPSITPMATKRFPRPKSTSAMSSSPLSKGVSEHILATTSTSPRPPSPLKFCTTISDPASGILPSFSSHGPALSKVYGSVLQPKETLALHSCAICSAVFSPDSTIYPNPSDPDVKAFLCRQCFAVNGGSKGNCPSCSRPVLALKAEGGFVQSGGKYWHKGCFNCMSCFKNVGNTPMVDLLGRPSCADCFDNCLKRDHPATPKKHRSSANNSPNISARLSSSYGGKSREGSPMIEELEQRLGIVKSREGTPVFAESESPTRSVSLRGESPQVHQHSKLRDPLAEISPESLSEHSIPPQQLAQQKEVKESQLVTLQPSLNLLIANSQGSTTQPSGTVDIQAGRFIFPENASTKVNPICNKCQQPILNSRQFVTMPGTDENVSPKLYHNECFTCSVCGKPINDSKRGQASFVLATFGPSHAHCAPTDQSVVRRPPLITPLEISARDIFDSTTIVSPTVKYAKEKNTSRMEQPVSTTQPRAVPRFGGQSACPGCQNAVSPMERGVVPGPQGTRWHASCLVCGGKKSASPARLLGREDKQKGQPGCGKRLDSAAKSDGEGGIWCRECLLLIGIGGSPQTSPTKIPLVPLNDTTKMASQSTGTTIKKQFTGTASSESILRQYTGSGLSPTRSISPTKQLSMMKPGMRPRPKSVIGIRLKSVDEGRGMFLIKQMTGQVQR